MFTILLALAAPVAVPSSAPITVTAHPWAPFISPMGEPFRAHSTSEDTLAAWFRQADRNNDGMLTNEEMVADAERFFSRLDNSGDGEIDPDELNHYEWEVAPEIQVNSRTRRPPGQPAAVASLSDDANERPRDRRKRRQAEDETSLGLDGALQGAARYGLLDMPEPVAAADADFNRGISLGEFRQAAMARFGLLDSGRKGKLSLAQLQALRQTLQARTRDAKALDMRVGNAVPSQP
ncbi:MAG TPA: EF-hand domain-containing protein [Sphingomicrobium sp.]